MLAQVVCKHCSDRGFYPYCFHCKKTMGGIDMKSKKNCNYCDNKGIFPFCPKCSRNVNGKHIVKQKSHYLTKDEERQRYRDRMNMDDLVRMYKNMLKVDAESVYWPLEQAYLILHESHLTTTGFKPMDEEIYLLYGEPNTWT